MKYLRTVAVAAFAAALMGGSAIAQQEGLVNVNVEGNNVQVPIGVAAQACDLDVNVLSEQVKGTDEAACTIDQATAAEHNIGGQNGGGNGQQSGGGQEGLVNVNVAGNNVQVPVGIAAQVCDVNANVIATQFLGTDEAACEIDQETAAQHNIGGQNGQQGGGGQEGLVNVNVAGNNVQVPVGIAAQVCDLDANVLAAQFVGNEEAACEIDQATAAQHNIGG